MRAPLLAATAFWAAPAWAAFELYLPPAKPDDTGLGSVIAQTENPDPDRCAARLLPGDTLSTFAARELGDASRWPEIQGLNHIRDPNRVRAGDLLKIPCGEGPGEPPTPSAMTEEDLRRAAAEAHGQPGAAETDECSVVTRSGDSLSGIAARELGDASRWPEIQGLNHIRDPGSIGVGWTLAIPCGEEAAAARDPRDPPEPVPPAADVAAALPGLPGVSCHTVAAEGDTLASIAGRELGDASRWEEIQLLNSIEDASQLAVGQRLAIPCDAEGGPELPVWRASPGEMLDDVIAGWALAAGWSPIIMKRWDWRMDGPFQHEGNFLDAVRALLEGFPTTGQAPGVVIYENKVLVLAYR